MAGGLEGQQVLRKVAGRWRQWCRRQARTARTSQRRRPSCKLQVQILSAGKQVYVAARAAQEAQAGRGSEKELQLRAGLVFVRLPGQGNGQSAAATPAAGARLSAHTPSMVTMQ